jgi:bifunctional DNase/RNase
MSSSNPPAMLEVDLREVVTQSDREQTCTMLLEERVPEASGRPRRVLPIYIGPVEALALGRAALGDRTPRPQTHDLVINVSEALGATLLRAMILRLDRHGEAATYIGAIEYLTAAGDRVVADARPSDALVVATLGRVPIFVATSVMAAAGMPLPDDPDADPPSSGVDGS